MENQKIKSIETTVGISTLNKYIAVITGFYKWIDDNYETAMSFKEKANTFRARKSFMYGQIYSYNYKYIVDSYIAMLKPSKEYMKWYNNDEKELLCNHFNTLRDESVLRLTFEGFRIDEVLSITLESYDPVERIVRPTRSKVNDEIGVMVDMQVWNTYATLYAYRGNIENLRAMTQKAFPHTRDNREYHIYTLANMCLLAIFDGNVTEAIKHYSDARQMAVDGNNLLAIRQINDDITYLDNKFNSEVSEAVYAHIKPFIDDVELQIQIQLKEDVS